MLDLDAYSLTECRSPSLPSTWEAIDPRLCELLEWWCGQCGPCRFPQWNPDFVFELKSWLPNLFMVRFEGDQGRYSLVGTALVEQFGVDLTGQPLVQSGLGEGSQHINRTCLACRREARPVHSFNSFLHRSGMRLLYQRLCLPFGRDGRVDRLLGCLYFQPPPEEPEWFARIGRFNGGFDTLL